MAAPLKSMSPHLAAFLLAGLLTAPAAAQETPPPAPWGAAQAEHLLNRAAFGARPAEIARAVALGREALVEELLTGGKPRADFDPENPMADARREAMASAGATEEERKAERRERRRLDEQQLADFSARWVGRMVAGDDPLREKLTLFWHGHFASSQTTVKDSYAMIRQNELFYACALGSFGDLLHGVLRDPALLSYLDNDENREGRPNENLARELLELFTLGPGHYTETDVQETARALTGWTESRGTFRVLPGRHDRGTKTILGATGRFDGDDLAELLLRQEACGPFVAGELIAWFEGVEPSDARRAEYGRFFAASGYDVTALLRRLFNDPAFYRDEVRASRIASPVEVVVGLAQRLGSEPAPRLLTACCAILGQHLFRPPSVKGWDEGEAWITTSSLMLRANVAGLMLGVVSGDELLAGAAGEPEPRMSEEGAEEGMQDAGEPMDAPHERKLGLFKALVKARAAQWRTRTSLVERLAGAGCTADGDTVDALAAELLAVPLPSETRAFLVEELGRLRRAAGLDEHLLASDREPAERVLRELSHVLLSLPEAQLL